MNRALCIAAFLIALITSGIAQSNDPAPTPEPKARAGTSVSHQGDVMLTAAGVRQEMGRIADELGGQLSEQPIGAEDGRIFNLQLGDPQDQATYAAVIVYAKRQSFMDTMEEAAPHGVEAGRVCNATINSGRWGAKTYESTEVADRVTAALRAMCPLEQVEPRV